MTQPTSDCKATTMISSSGLQASLLRPPSEKFHCEETNREGSSTVAFSCSVAASTPTSFTFYCREPSYGVLTSDEPTVSVSVSASEHPPEKRRDENAEEEEEDGGDFDIGMMLFSEEKYPYALAGRTGFQIWPGSRILVDALTFPRPGDGLGLQKWQQALGRKGGFRVLELGAGVGVVGASLAAAGAEVLLTDLAKVVDQSLVPNLIRNSNNQRPVLACPEWLDQKSIQAVPIGRGWAAASSLDWNEPLDDQLTKEQQNVDLIIASDCVWLASMLIGLLGTVSAIFQQAVRDGQSKRNPKLLLSFQRRDSEMFTTVDRVMNEISSRKWNVECLAWYPVKYAAEENIETDQDSSTKEVFLFEVSPTFYAEDGIGDAKN